MKNKKDTKGANSTGLNLACIRNIEDFQNVMDILKGLLALNEFSNPMLYSMKRTVLKHTNDQVKVFMNCTKDRIKELQRIIIEKQDRSKNL